MDPPVCSPWGRFGCYLLLFACPIIFASIMKKEFIGRTAKSLSLALAIFSGCIFGSVLPAWSQEIVAGELERCFLAMPESVLPIVTMEERNDLCRRAGHLSGFTHSASLESSLGGTVTFLLNRNFIRIQTSTVGEVFMRILPFSDSSSVICVVTTVLHPVADSRIDFYTTEWKPLKADRFWQQPRIEDFFLPHTDRQSYAYQSIYASLTPSYMQVSLSEESDTLSIRQTVTETLAEEEKPLAAIFLSPEPLVYRWQSGRFVRQVR